MKIVSTLALAVALTSAASAQTAGGLHTVTAPMQQGNRGIVGILAPNGTFQPLIASSPQGALPSSHVFTGTFTGTLNIAIGSPLPSGSTILCQLQLQTDGVSAAGQVDAIDETQQVSATGVTATAATCNFTLPYQWGLFANTPNATVRDAVEMFILVSAQTSTGNGRTSFVTYGTVAVPATGSFTNFSLAARI
ncbi:MAG TPA: hypothetical protein VGG48_11260 [Rhizomicrobium sp.]|jgi:hypothetical protein